MKHSILATLIACLAVCGASAAFAQDSEGHIDKSKVPATADKPAGFLPAGWKLETEAKGDVNGDKASDSAMIVQEITEAEGTSRGRAVIIATAQADGSWKRAAVVDRIIQCVDCGGNRGDVGITIKKGVVIITDSSGSANAYGDQTYRFRWDAAKAEFQLIGADFVAGSGPDHINEASNNYLTGVRKTTMMRAKKKDVVKVTNFKISREYLGTVDIQALDEAAFKRIDN